MHAVLPAHLLERCSRFLEARVGLHFPRERWRDLERALRAVAADLGIESPAEGVERFLSERANAEELEVLISRLTVGETYFFRDPKAFEILQSRALPERIEAHRRAGKRLRIWSAGCASGEEPYSIAIAVSRALPDLAEWDLKIIGTDLNQRFLEKARAGIYTKWSFRGTTPELRKRYFQRIAENQFEVIPSIQKLVTFRRVNLVEDTFPARVNEASAMDIIFCRNVLMYFSRDQAQRVAANLYRALLEDGWMFPSGTEATRELYGQFTPVDVPDAIVYRKTAEPLPRIPEPAPAESATPDQAIVPSPPTETVVAAPVATAIERARQLADGGQLAAALAACDEALTAHKLTPLPHYLRGLILQEQGAPEEAAATFRRALYLDPDFVLAHFALGNLLRREGRVEEAVRCFANARRLLRDCDPATVLPEADGLTAGRLLATLETTENAL